MRVPHTPATVARRRSSRPCLVATPTRLDGILPARGRRGTTLIELVIASSIVLIAFGIFLSSVTALNVQRNVNSENGLASVAAQRVIEEMYNVPFDEVFARFNADPADDPDGAGTAPGNLFPVDGLSAPEGAPLGMVGEVLFPTIELAPGVVELRERVVDAGLGMPRDLTGEGVLDELDHADDYYLLPVRLRMRWTGRSGTREADFVVTLSEFRKDE